MQEQFVKDMVIEKIYSINDIDYLEALNKILTTTPASNLIYRTDKRQKESIKMGQQQIADGDFVYDDDLNVEEDEWLKS